MNLFEKMFGGFVGGGQGAGAPAPAPSPAPVGAPAGAPAPAPAPAPLTAESITPDIVEQWLTKKPTVVTPDPNAPQPPADPLAIDPNALAEQISKHNFLNLTAEQITEMATDPAKLVAATNAAVQAATLAAITGTAKMAKTSLDQRLAEMQQGQEQKIAQTLNTQRITGAIDAIPELQGALLAPVRQQVAAAILRDNPAASAEEVRSIVGDVILKQLGARVGPAAGLLTPQQRQQQHIDLSKPKLGQAEAAGLDF